MKNLPASLIRLALLIFIWIVWWWALNARLSTALNLSIIVGGVLLTYPLIWLARRFLDRNPTPNRTLWTTTFVHVLLGFVFGVPLIRALLTHRHWAGNLLPIPTGIGLALVLLTGAAALLVVLNLALKGLGAPFFIALSRRLAVDWLYAWTRNPMVLAGLALLLSLGVWYQSLPFIIWALFLVSPALLFFVKIYEERELELRFGESYLEYKSRTPMLFPRKPKA
jgi:protein-S-isoprenylcysteine O-methyltransferase Ste14